MAFFAQVNMSAPRCLATLDHSSSFRRKGLEASQVTRSESKDHFPSSPMRVFSVTEVLYGHPNMFSYTLFLDLRGGQKRVMSSHYLQIPCKTLEDGYSGQLLYVHPPIPSSVWIYYRPRLDLDIARSVNQEHAEHTCWFISFWCSFGFVTKQGNNCKLWT